MKQLLHDIFTRVQCELHNCAKEVHRRDLIPAINSAKTINDLATQAMELEYDTYGFTVLIVGGEDEFADLETLISEYGLNNKFRNAFFD